MVTGKKMNINIIATIVLGILLFEFHYSVYSANLFDKLKEKIESTQKSKEAKVTDQDLDIQGTWSTIEHCGFKKMTGITLNEAIIKSNGNKITIELNRLLDSFGEGYQSCKINDESEVLRCRISKNGKGTAKNFSKEYTIKNINKSQEGVVVDLEEFKGIELKKYDSEWREMDAPHVHISAVNQFVLSNNILRLKQIENFYEIKPYHVYAGRKYSEIYQKNYKFRNQAESRYYGSEETLKYVRCDDKINEVAINNWIEVNKIKIKNDEENLSKCTEALKFLDVATTQNSKKQLSMIVGDIARNSDKKFTFKLNKEFCEGIESRAELCANNQKCREWIFSNFENEKKLFKSEAADLLLYKYKNYMLLSDCNEIRKNYPKKYIDQNVFLRIQKSMKQIELSALNDDKSIDKDTLWNEAAVEYKLGLGILLGSNKSNPQNFDREVANQCQLKAQEMDNQIIPTKQEDFKIKKDF
jgi:hypothetical protein